MSAPAVAAAFARAVVTRDFEGARELLHADVDFRGMTPRRIWEADGPAGVEDALRAWLTDPERDVASIEAAQPGDPVADTARVGWIVRGTSPDGPFVFEQQAYLREADGHITWLRVMCTGPRPLR